MSQPKSLIRKLSLGLGHLGGDLFDFDLLSGVDLRDFSIVLII